MFLKYEHIQNQDCPTGTALTIMADDLSSIPKSYTMEGENQLQVALCFHMYTVICMPKSIHKPRIHSSNKCSKYK